MKGDFDQLAAVLKSCGIVASHYDAANMAQSINEGVKKSGEYFARAYHEFQQDGAKDYTQPEQVVQQEGEPIMIQPNPSLMSVFESAPQEEVVEQPMPEPQFEPIADIVLESPAAEEKKTLSIFEEEEEVLQVADDILREKEVEQSVEKQEVLQTASRTDIEIKLPSEELKAEAQPVEQLQVAVPRQEINVEDVAKRMAEEMFQKMMAEQKAQQQKLQEQLAQQQQMMQKLMQQQQAARQPVEQPRPQKPQQTFSYPPKSAAPESKCFRELPIDRSKPKAGLSREEMQATDITKWFNFSKR